MDTLTNVHFTPDSSWTLVHIDDATELGGANLEPTKIVDREYCQILKRVASFGHPGDAERSGSGSGQPSTENMEQCYDTRVHPCGAYHSDQARSSAALDLLSVKPSAVEDYLESARDVFVKRDRVSESAAHLRDHAEASMLCQETRSNSNAFDAVSNENDSWARHRQLLHALADAEHELLLRELRCINLGFDPSKWVCDVLQSQSDNLVGKVNWAYRPAGNVSEIASKAALMDDL